MPALKKENNSKLKYKPATDIFKLFGLIDFPYPSKISFEPLISYWKKQLNSPDPVQQLIASKIDRLLAKDGRNLNQPINKLEELEGLDELISLLTSVYFPYHDEKSLVRLTGPFNTLPFYHSPAIKELLSMNSIKTNIDQNPEKVFKFIVYRAGSMILNSFYGQNLKFDTPYIFQLNKVKLSWQNTIMLKSIQVLQL